MRGGIESYADALRVWQRHERSRQHGVPIVSVWIGDVDGFERSLSRSVVWSSAASVEATARDWWREIAARRDLVGEAFGFLARELGESEQELLSSWSARALRERRMWLAEREGPRLGGALELLRASLEPEAESEFAARLGRLLAWLPRPECLGVANPEALRGVLSWVVEAPHLAVLARIDPAAWQRLSAQLDDRSRTLLEQGLISREIAREPAGAPTEQRLQRALAAARTARSSGAPDAAEVDSRARSLAEQRLYELLEQDPLTRGLFELNGRMPFTFGNARAEVDLVCSELRVAVEVDGYFHFQQADAYRRDRRKDVLLQHQGYLVSRHLAEDVEQRAPEVVRAIRELVKRRRRRRRRERAE